MNKQEQIRTAAEYCAQEAIDNGFGFGGYASREQQMQHLPFKADIDFLRDQYFIDDAESKNEFVKIYRDYLLENAD